MTKALFRAASLAWLTCVLLLAGCAMVEVESVSPREYIAMKRGDILSTGELSAATLQTIRISGLDEGPCAQPKERSCVIAFHDAAGIPTHRRLAAQAELWTQQAILLSEQQVEGLWTDEQFAVWFEAARHAYAYLFFNPRTTGERTFEDRQTQVRDYYNYAVQETATALFQRIKLNGATRPGDAELQRVGEWTLRTDMRGVRLPAGLPMPRELIPASSLKFAGLHSVYRRDGFGAELVASMPDRTSLAVDAAIVEAGSNTAFWNRGPAPGDTQRRGIAAQPSLFSEMPSPVLSVLFRFEAEDLESVLATKDVTVALYDPYRRSSVDLHGQRVPLAANFTAGYGLWLARSGFAEQSLRSLLGREQGIESTHLYMMQPYDPDRRIIVTLHGLASSPEAWVNLANELLGDEALREHFQVWQVYYPTNLPIAMNHATIRRTLEDALRHFDPSGTSRASRDIVVIGHSMGGVIARLMVSDAGQTLWETVANGQEVDPKRLERVRPHLEPLLGFKPMPQIRRAVFIAAPHRGTPFAANRVSRWLSNLIRLPVAILSELSEISAELAGSDAPGGGQRGEQSAGAPSPAPNTERIAPDSGRKPLYVPNSIDNLRDTDPFVRAAADLPISPRVRFHSIVARTNPQGPLAETDDGLVPYKSAHLDGAVSEKIIVSGHSVQQTAPAILEIRRILLEDLKMVNGGVPR
jgi:pimeloyl-ACP methyl ester carboxylesterase